jgi:hypothetical protein
VAAIMNPEKEHGLSLVEWFPMLFDLLMVALLMGGCLLFWLNLRPRKDFLTPMETPDHDAEARGEFPAQEPAELSAEYNAHSLDPPRSKEEHGADAEHRPSIAVDQNTYASRVASAMARSRKPSGGS